MKKSDYTIFANKSTFGVYQTSFITCMAAPLEIHSFFGDKNPFITKYSFPSAGEIIGTTSHKNEVGYFNGVLFESDLKGYGVYSEHGLGGAREIILVHLDSIPDGIVNYIKR